VILELTDNDMIGVGVLGCTILLTVLVFVQLRFHSAAGCRHVWLFNCRVSACWCWQSLCLQDTQTGMAFQTVCHACNGMPSC
jgi:hypothetical protein